MKMEDFYIGLVKKAVADNRLPLLEQQIGEGDLDAAFETAHALKGMYANLSLSPLTKPVSEITELLRSRTETDYSPLLAEAKVQFEALCSL
jgi:HPt (histidine-containing phosphotransfer) domain-containing protein